MHFDGFARLFFQKIMSSKHVTRIVTRIVSQMCQFWDGGTNEPSEHERGPPVVRQREGTGRKGRERPKSKGRERSY